MKYALTLIITVVALTGCVTKRQAEQIAQQRSQADLDAISGSLIRGVERLAAERDYWRNKATTKPEQMPSL